MIERLLERADELDKKLKVYRPRRCASCGKTGFHEKGCRAQRRRRIAFFGVWVPLMGLTIGLDVVRHDWSALTSVAIVWGFFGIVFGLAAFLRSRR